ncbi:unnamed protein product, partial [Medioppia subpectinata]
MAEKLESLSARTVYIAPPPRLPNRLVRLVVVTVDDTVQPLWGPYFPQLWDSTAGEKCGPNPAYVQQLTDCAVEKWAIISNTPPCGPNPAYVQQLTDCAVEKWAIISNTPPMRKSCENENLLTEFCDSLKPKAVTETKCQHYLGQYCAGGNGN